MNPLWFTQPPMGGEMQPFSIKPGNDLSPGFPDIANQSPLGACQSFAMAAWLDYIFYFKTGKVITLSEKQLAYKLLQYMTDEFWDAGQQKYPGQDKLLAGKPTLGYGIAPY